MWSILLQSVMLCRLCIHHAQVYLGMCLLLHQTNDFCFKNEICIAMMYKITTTVFGSFGWQLL